MTRKETSLTLYPINLTPLRMNILHRHSIVELLFLLISIVSQPIPLTGHLRVEGPDIIVDAPRRFGEEVLVEELAVEEAQIFLGVEWPI